jgi:hypothetical protein
VVFNSRTKTLPALSASPTSSTVTLAVEVWCQKAKRHVRKRVERRAHHLNTVCQASAGGETSVALAVLGGPAGVPGVAAGALGVVAAAARCVDLDAAAEVPPAGMLAVLFPLGPLPLLPAAAAALADVPPPAPLLPAVALPCWRGFSTFNSEIPSSSPAGHSFSSCAPQPKDGWWVAKKKN